MCKIYETRKSKTAVYIEVDDGISRGLKKLSIDKFDYAKSFGNNNFVNAVARWTNDRDFNDSVTAIRFLDPKIRYSV